MKEFITLKIEDFGPFESAEVRLKPLTIFIGRNSVGRSMLMR
jgi:predicted ATPase